MKKRVREGFAGILSKVVLYTRRLHFFRFKIVRDVANTPSLLSSTIPIFSNLDTFLYHII